jgi:transcriptional regulator with XRE-family HTH domain
VERGERNLSLLNIHRLAEALDVPIEKLFPGDLP